VAEPAVITSSTATTTITTTTTTAPTFLTESVLMSFGAGSPIVDCCIGPKLLDDPSPTLSAEFVDFVADPVVITFTTTTIPTATTTSPTSTGSVLISAAGVEGCIGLTLLDDPSNVLSADFEPSMILLHDDVPSPEQLLVLDIQPRNEGRNDEMDEDHHSDDQEPCFVAIATPLSSVKGPALRRSKRLAEIRLRQEKVGLTAVTLSTSVQVQVPELLGSIVVNGRRRSSRHFKKTV